MVDSHPTLMSYFVLLSRIVNYNPVNGRWEELWNFSFGKVLRGFSPGFQSPPGWLPSLKLTANAPENGWLEDELSFPFGARPIFRPSWKAPQKPSVGVPARVKKNISWRILGWWFSKCSPFCWCFSDGLVGCEISFHLVWRGAENLRPAGDLVLLPGQQCRQWLEMWWEDMSRSSLKKSDQDKERS